MTMEKNADSERGTPLCMALTPSSLHNTPGSLSVKGDARYCAMCYEMGHPLLAPRLIFRSCPGDAQLEGHPLI
jgi:hypothetical protein